jgi:hypothetical protein
VSSENHRIDHRSGIKSGEFRVKQREEAIRVVDVKPMAGLWQDGFA